MKMNFEKIKNIIKSKKTKKILLACLAYAGTLAILALFSVLLVSTGIKNRTDGRVISLEETKELTGIDCIIVLGAGVKSDNTPSDMLRDRLDTAYAIYESGICDRILVSGDHGRNNYNEVGVMKKYLVDKGVPDSAVFMDHAGFSTYETMYRANEIFLTESYYKKVIIVTQEYHLYRALYIAENVGLNAYGVPADLHTYYGQSYRDAREHLARLKDFFTCYLETKPKYLGETISVFGDGNITNDSFYNELTESGEEN